MYIKDGRLMDIEANTPSGLKKVDATDIQITNFINDRVKPIREIVRNANTQIEASQNDGYLSDHGKKEKKRIHQLMQIERPEDWGKTIFREWHLGDEHHEESEEVGGVIIRRISAITATDAWHAESGFKGAIRKAQAFIWDKELGKQFTMDSNVVREYGSEI